jgi:hypothetical protein
MADLLRLVRVRVVDRTVFPAPLAHVIHRNHRPGCMHFSGLLVPFAWLISYLVFY